MDEVYIHATEIESYATAKTTRPANIKPHASAKRQFTSGGSPLRPDASRPPGSPLTPGTSGFSLFYPIAPTALQRQFPFPKHSIRCAPDPSRLQTPPASRLLPITPGGPHPARPPPHSLSLILPLRANQIHPLASRHFTFIQVPGMKKPNTGGLPDSRIPRCVRILHAGDVYFSVRLRLLIAG